jgi:hypothetical protein
MAEKIEIEMLIKPDGTIEMVTHGLKGASCMTETDAIEKALGRTVRREKTREFYESGTASTKIKTGR